MQRKPTAATRRRQRGLGRSRRSVREPEVAATGRPDTAATPRARSHATAARRERSEAHLGRNRRTPTTTGDQGQGPLQRRLHRPNQREGSRAPALAASSYARPAQARPSGGTADPCDPAGADAATLPFGAQGDSPGPRRTDRGQSPRHERSRCRPAAPRSRAPAAALKSPARRICRRRNRRALPTPESDGTAERASILHFVK